MNKVRVLQGVAMLWLAAWSLSATAATVWTGAAGDRDWFNTNNWDTLSVPGEGAEVSVPAGADLLITNKTAGLSSFIMAGGTVTFSNWYTRLQADTVEINGGTLTLPPAFTEIQESNRVWIVCEDFTLAGGGENRCRWARLCDGSWGWRRRFQIGWWARRIRILRRHTDGDMVG